MQAGRAHPPAHPAAYLEVLVQLMHSAGRAHPPAHPAAYLEVLVQLMHGTGGATRPVTQQPTAAYLEVCLVC